jgi:hypothetical protein
MQMKATDDLADFDTWSSAYNAGQDIVLSTATREKSGMVTLAPYSEDSNSYGLFRLSGDCVESPTNDPWKSKDSFTAKIVFTFKALPLTSA